MKIAILEMGTAGEALAAKHGHFADMIGNWLRPSLPHAVISALKIYDGESLPKVDDYQAYVLTGSPFGVYENHPWLSDVREFLQHLSIAKIPFFGICFGHQLMAQTFGATVEKSIKGWGVGAQMYDFHTADLPIEPVFLFHQDQVLTVPDMANVIGGSDFCPIGALSYDFPAISVQFHPEFTKEFMNDLIDKKQDLLGDESQQKIFKKSLSQPVDNTYFSKWVADFFQQHVKQQ